MPESREIDRVLGDEIRLIGFLIDAAKKFQSDTKIGEALRDGWIDDLNSWRDTNRALIQLDDPTLKSTLKAEEELLGALLACVGGNDPLSNWWRDHLTTELASAKRWGEQGLLVEQAA